MHTTIDVPEIAVSRIIASGGPYRCGETLSLAFTQLEIARLSLHDRELPAQPRLVRGAVVPEGVIVEIVRPAGPFSAGDKLVLSFTDPRIARIHRLGIDTCAGADAPAPPGECVESQATSVNETIDSFNGKPLEFGRLGEMAEVSTLNVNQRAGDVEEELHRTRRESLEGEPPEQRIAETRLATPPLESQDREAGDGNIEANRRTALVRHDRRAFDATSASPAERVDPPATPTKPQGVCVRLEWNPDRVRRFVQLVDRLFTVDRLGWYRHAFAMRLLVPDDISLSDPLAEREARRYLGELRSAVVETLGQPLLAAFMPSFAVTPEWLDSVDVPAAARALAGLREAVVPHLQDVAHDLQPDVGAKCSVGVVDGATLLVASSGSFEALLPAFIPAVSADESVTACASEYRSVLLDVFGQTARCAEAVRLKQMAQPNHALDDRLWHLVGAVQVAFGASA
jgi:hypothetical protein